jgi:uncharacterized protein
VAGLRIHIGALQTGRNELELTTDPAELDLGEWLSFLSPLSVAGYVDRFGETVTVRGRVQAEVEETCGRCTRTFRRPLDVEVMVYCDREGSDDEALSRELEREGQLVYHDGVSLDITGPVREAIILSLPLSPICGEDCRGLCPGCGADLNTEACRCTGKPIDPRWEALKRLTEREP